MPSGNFHDIVTFALAAPVFGATYGYSGDAGVSAAAAGAFLFGGLMFGPDLDTVSKQYARWGPARMLWLPYRAAFRHRSRWSHGLVFGTLFRVIYFIGVTSLMAYGAVLAYVSAVGGEMPGIGAFGAAWGRLGDLFFGELGARFLMAAFTGMWAGAASHTFTDMAGTYIKTGRITDFL
jgi:uncharacterized metal-binding protein